MQRYFDIFFSLISIIILSPIFILITIILKSTGEGEVFYIQDRIGKDGNIFRLYKFATMLKNSPNMGTFSITIKNDSRILPFGRFLRLTKINELPQLLNVLFGNMSIIGPRPLTFETFNAYSLDIQDLIKQVQPGLSGVGSIIFRVEENMLTDHLISENYYKDVIAPYKGLLEHWYIKNKNLKNYFILILVTIWVVFVPRSGLIWNIFSDLPTPPKKLQHILNYPITDIAT